MVYLFLQKLPKVMLKYVLSLLNSLVEVKLRQILAILAVMRGGINVTEIGCDR